MSTHQQSDGQTDRQTDRQRDKEIYTNIDRQTSKLHKHRHHTTLKQAGRQEESQTDKQTN